MTDADLAPLDPELASAYAAERRVTTATMDAASISRERLMMTALARMAQIRAEAPPPRRVSRRRRWAVAVAAVAAVSVGYAAGRLTPPESPRVEAPRVPEPPRASAPPIDAAPPDTAPPVDAPVPADARAPSVSPSVTPPPPTKDAGEALLLDQARAALRRHLPADALAALDQHARRFPQGQLREERDVLRIEVALAQDRRGDANELIAAYLEHYPNGSLRARVAALQRQLDELIRQR